MQESPQFGTCYADTDCPGRKPCEHCGKFGHPSNLCWTLPNNANTRPEYWKGPNGPKQTNPTQQFETGNVAVDQRHMDSDSEMSLAFGHLNADELQSIDASLRAMGLSLDDPSVWIGDTGATAHNTAYIVDTVNHRAATEGDHIVGVTGAPAAATTIVDIQCQVMKSGGPDQYVKLKDVAYVPTARYNLFSLTKLMMSGWSLNGDKSVGIIMRKGTVELHFDKTVRTTKGVLYVIILKRRATKNESMQQTTMMEAIMQEPYVEDATTTSQSAAECGAVAVTIKPITINKAHVMLGHMGHVESKAICDYYGQPLTTRGFRQCAPCGKAKAKQLAVTQNNEEHVVAGPDAHRIFLDISSVKHGPATKSLVSKPYWLLIVVEFVNFKISTFLKHKSHLPEAACKIVYELQTAGVNVKYVRLDNAGENFAFANMANSKEWNLRLVFEFTGAGTPQRNYLVEIGFSTLWGRLRALFDAAMVPEEIKYKLVREGVAHLTFLDGLIVYDNDGAKKTKHGWMFGHDPKIILPLRVWGQAGIVRLTNTMKSKLSMRGEPGMFVGYAIKSSPDTYRLYLPELNSVHETRDVQWSKRMFYAPADTGSVHATDSVVITQNRQQVPLRTMAPITAMVPVAPANAPSKGPVQFRTQVDYVPTGFDTTESADGDDNVPPGWMPLQPMEPWNTTPSIIELGRNNGDDFSTLSSSIGKRKMHIEIISDTIMNRNLNDDGELDADEEEAEGTLHHPVAANAKGNVDDGGGAESPNVDNGGEAEPNLSSVGTISGETKSDSDNQYDQHDMGTYSSVDSQAYKDITEEEEDDDAFIERLGHMVDVADILDNEGNSNVEGALEDRESNVGGLSGVNLRRSSRTIRAPTRLIEEMGGVSVDGGMTYKYGLMQVYKCVYNEMALVGAGIGGGFGHTTELDVKKYNEAFRSNDLDELAKWVHGIDEEHARFLFDEVWVAVMKGEHANVIPITMTWALKQKASGVVRARCNVRGFEQIPHIHYDPDSKSSPVTTQAAVFIVFVLLMMNAVYVARILDVKGAFLKGRFSSPDEVLLLEVPQGFRWVYDKLGEEMEQGYNDGQPMTKEEVMRRTKELYQEWIAKPLKEQLHLLKLQKNQRGGSRKVYLQMQRTIYGSVQAARAFWMELQKAFLAMGYTRSAADPCLYFRWDEDGELCVWLTWIDDCIIVGSKHVVDRERAKMMQLFECEDVGPMEEYVGNKIEMCEKVMKLTQPVLLQSFTDEFGVTASGEHLPAKPGPILSKGEDKDVLNAKQQKKYRSGVGKLRYLTTWSRPDILNAVRENSRYLEAPTSVHYDAMLRIMDYCLSTADRGRIIAPVDCWDGSKDFEFVVSGVSDAAYNQCPDTRKSVSGNTTEVNGVPVITKSVMQDTRKLSVTEAELDSAVTNVQDMLFVRQIIESMGLRVKLPMILRVDNQGVRELINNWSVGGRTRHVANKAMFLRELKEWGVLVVEYLAGTAMYSDTFTKNLPRTVFDKHVSHYVSVNSSDSGAGDRQWVELEQQRHAIEKPVEQQGARESAEREEVSTKQEWIQPLQTCARWKDW